MLRVSVRIRDCVHYRGFRYGGFNNNIYEDYVVGLAKGAQRRNLREKLVNRVLAYTGNDFSSALNIVLEQKYPPWIYPWTFRAVYSVATAPPSAHENPDIICHHSPQGVLASHINREFGWLEGAFAAMQVGYKPEQCGYVRLMRMKGCEGSRYLVLDGNHRIAAMHALGVNELLADVETPLLGSIHASRLWPGVLCGAHRHRDAIAIFNRYFEETNRELSELPTQRLIVNEPLEI